MKIKLPTFSEITSNFVKTFKRFPVALLYSYVFAVYAVFLIHSPLSNERFYFGIPVFVLAIIVSVSVAIFSEIKKLSDFIKIVLNFLIFAILIAYIFLIKENFPDVSVYRMIALIFSSIILLLTIPFFKKNNELNYWKYNFRVIGRVVLSAIYSLFIYLGITIAILIVIELFNVDINDRIFGDIAVIILGFFTVTNILSNLPDEFYVEEEINFPKSLRVFVEYILLPLTAIYLLILYVYSVRIIINWEIPQNIVSYLVISFSALGILSLMIIFPINKDSKNKWVSTFAKWFYWALLPLIILLFISIFTRISEYGTTEKRYIIVALSVWLLGVSIYSLITKQKNIKFIPISFSVIFLLILIGPWSIFNVSKRTQINTLDKILTENNIVANGVINQSETYLPDSVYYQVYDIVQYLTYNHGKNIVPDKYGIIIDSIENFSEYELVDSIVSSFNISTEYYGATLNYSYLSYYFEPEFVDVRGVDYLLPLLSGLYQVDTLGLTFKVEDNGLFFEYDSVVKIIDYDEIITPLIKKYRDSYVRLEPEEATFNLQIQNLNLTVIIISISCDFDKESTNNKFSNVYLDCWLLLDFKDVN